MGQVGQRLLTATAKHFNLKLPRVYKISLLLWAMINNSRREANQRGNEETYCIRRWQNFFDCVRWRTITNPTFAPPPEPKGFFNVQ
jgi:hypothetical protein